MFNIYFDSIRNDSINDILHFITIVNVLDYTINAIQEIDNLTINWIKFI